MLEAHRSDHAPFDGVARSTICEPRAVEVDTERLDAVTTA
jgi:hypothetical protein